MSMQQHVTTTHSCWGSGDPHLRIRRGEHRQNYPLALDVTRIGSQSDLELVLPGAKYLHATIVHDENDEYVLTMHGPGETNAVSSDPDERVEILRTGSRFTIGEWEFVFGRAEASDHGRPYGGRQGGEWSHQKTQPPRPDYHTEAEIAAHANQMAGVPTVLQD